MGVREEVREFSPAGDVGGPYLFTIFDGLQGSPEGSPSGGGIGGVPQTLKFPHDWGLGG